MSLIFTALCGILLGGLVLFALNAHNKSKGVYDDYIAPITESECKVKKMLPMGLYIDENVDFSKILPKVILPILGKQKNDARMMIFELRDAKYGDYYFSVYCAEKKVCSLMVMIAANALGMLMCLQGDGSTGFGFGVAGVIFGIAFNFLMDNNLKKKLEERHTMLRMEFPDFVNKLVLLINAGMTVNRAWEKIVNDNKKDTPLQQELRIALLSMKDGTPEAYAIEAFGRRCKIKEIMKFTSVLISNLKKGGAELVPVLVQQSNECWEMRKGAAKELGSTAGVKMMLPMVMLLVAILMVVGCPAMFAMSGI
jgi:tight adherence protein C